jgi:hypothetical protein
VPSRTLQPLTQVSPLKKLPVPSQLILGFNAEDEEGQIT